MGQNRSSTKEKIHSTTMSKSKQQTKDPSISYDIVITYSKLDIKIAERLFISISECGLKCFLDEIEKQGGDLSLDTKANILILSNSSVANDYFCDQIALAYISNKPIIPLFLENQNALKEKLEFSSKLVLLPLEWLNFIDPSLYEQNVKQIADLVTKEVSSLLKSHDTPTATLTIKNVSVKYQPVRTRDIVGEDLYQGKSSLSYEFWSFKLGRVDRVPWFRFEQAFLKEFDKELSNVFSGDDKQISWLIKMIHKDLFNNNEEIDYAKYLEFTGGHKGKDYFFQRIVSLATEKLAIMEVFSMSSTVRLKAIDNLSKYTTPQVLESLIQLTSEEDANVRTIACIGIGKVAKTGIVALNQSHINILMDMVKDKDRLVREAACITLGRLKIDSAVTLLLDRWRNDVIYNVRVAASDALKLMDNESANQAVYLTDQLQKEVKNLSEESMDS